jgi:arabinose-5-phosphate isomerase
MFLHAAEATRRPRHDAKGRYYYCISKSGNSPEIKVLVPLLKRFGNTLIAITGNMTFLAKELITF